MTIHKLGCGSTAFQGRGPEVVGSILDVQENEPRIPGSGRASGEKKLRPI
jgi:hypothetical protein